MNEITELRERLGWSKSRLAREIGVAQITVRHWEQGLYKPSPLALARLRDVETTLVQENEKGG